MHPIKDSAEVIASVEVQWRGQVYRRVVRVVSGSCVVKWYTHGYIVSDTDITSQLEDDYTKATKQL